MTILLPISGEGNVDDVGDHGDSVDQHGDAVVHAEPTVDKGSFRQILQLSQFNSNKKSGKTSQDNNNNNSKTFNKFNFGIKSNNKRYVAISTKMKKASTLYFLCSWACLTSSFSAFFCSSFLICMGKSANQLTRLQTVAESRTQKGAPTAEKSWRN